MTDIVERLRLEAKQQKANGIFPSTVSAMREAADEIKRLRKLSGLFNTKAIDALEEKRGWKERAEVVRNKALEEAAQTAEEWESATAAATAIRALKEEEHD